MIDIDAVTKSSMCQGIVVSTENENSTYFERTNLDTHASMIVLDRNFHVVNYSGNKRKFILSVLNAKHYKFQP